MILYDVSPTDDVAVVSVQQVTTRLRLKNPTCLNVLLDRSLKYIAFHDELDEDFDIHKKHHLTEKRQRLMMPLDTAWRLIRDAEAGKILTRAERVL